MIKVSLVCVDTSEKENFWMLRNWLKDGVYAFTDIAVTYLNAYQNI